MAVRTGYKNKAAYDAPTYTVYGNTVKIAEPERTKRHRRRAAEPAVRPVAEHEYRKDLRIGLPTAIMLFITFVAVVFIVYNYLYLSASVDTHRDNIETLQAQLESLKNENNALEQSIDTSVDLSYVYNVAVNELGMVHAGESNTLEYQRTESEYVRQYESITK